MAESAYQLGPRSRRSVIMNSLTPSQVAVLVAALAVAGVAMAVLPMPTVHITRFALPVPLSMMVAAAAVFGGMALAFVRVSGLPAVEHVPQTCRFLKKSVRGQTGWTTVAQELGVEVLDTGEAAHADSLPPGLGSLRLVAVGRRLGVPAGVAHDRKAGTLTACLRVHLHSIGLLGVEDQRQRYANFGSILDSLAIQADSRWRLQLLKRTVPRRHNELADYLEQRLVDPGSPQSQAVYEVASAGGSNVREHELFVVLRCSDRDGKRSGADAVQAAGERLVGQLEEIGEALREADIALDGGGVLGVRGYARLIKDQVDPYDRELRDLLERETEEPGVAASHAWPDETNEHYGYWSSDSADHVSWWVKEWPKVPVREGWLTHLLLEKSGLVMNVSMVMRPKSEDAADRHTTRALMSEHESAKTRAEMGQVTKGIHGQQAEQAVRTEAEVGRGHSLWCWEANISVSVPRGDRAAREDAIRQVRQACKRSKLGPSLLGGMQEEIFARTLPLARGLQDSRLQRFASGMVATSVHARALGLFDGAASLGDRGLPWGHYLSTAGLHCYDQFELYGQGLVRDPNIVVWGKLGVGKSGAIKVHCRRQWATGRKIRVIDPSPTGEYELLSNDLDGTFLDLKPGGDIRLNPLASPTNRHALLKAVARAVMPRPLNALEPGLCDAALNEVMRASGYAEPTLPEVVKVLANPPPEMCKRLEQDYTEVRKDAKDLAGALRQLSDGELAGMFDGPTTPGLDLENRFLVVSLRSVRSTTSSLGILLACATAFMEAEDERQRREQEQAGVMPTQSILVVDEAFEIFPVPGIAQWLQVQVKQARKLGKSVILVMQRLSDLDAAGDDGSRTVKLVRGLMRDASTFILFKLEGEELDRTGETLHLSSSEVDAIDNLKFGEALHKVGGRPFVVRGRSAESDLPLVKTDQRMAVG